MRLSWLAAALVIGFAAGSWCTPKPPDPRFELDGLTRRVSQIETRRIDDLVRAREIRKEVEANALAVAELYSMSYDLRCLAEYLQERPGQLRIPIYWRWSPAWLAWDQCTICNAGYRCHVFGDTENPRATPR
jgi:hypothetical protein